MPGLNALDAVLVVPFLTVGGGGAFATLLNPGVDPEELPDASASPPTDADDPGLRRVAVDVPSDSLDSYQAIVEFLEEAAAETVLPRRSSRRSLRCSTLLTRTSDGRPPTCCVTSPQSIRPPSQTTATR